MRTKPRFASYAFGLAAAGAAAFVAIPGSSGPGSEPRPSEFSLAAAESAAPAVALRPQVVDYDCENALGYESRVPADDRAASRYYRPADGVGGPVAELRYFGDGSFDGTAPTMEVGDDQAGIVRWENAAGDPVGSLASKRLDAEGLRALADAVSGSNELPDGWRAVPASADVATVSGFSCRVGAAFVGVEAVSGSDAAQVAYAMNVDPTNTTALDGGAIYEFNRLDGSKLDVREATSEEWAELRAGADEQWKSWQAAQAGGSDR